MKLTLVIVPAALGRMRLTISPGQKVFARISYSCVHAGETVSTVMVVCSVCSVQSPTTKTSPATSADVEPLAGARPVPTAPAN